MHDICFHGNNTHNTVCQEFTICRVVPLSAMDRRPDLRELQEHVRTNKWHPLGLQLGLKDGDLVAIRQQYSSVDDCRRAMFSVWLDTTPEASRRELVKALKTVSVAENFMAKQYEAFIHGFPDSTHGM